MALSYSLNFKKFNLPGKQLLSKEGEAVFNRHFFRLKGKGANDHGEVINFTDIKEVKLEKDQFIFLTFSREKFVLSKMGSSFDQFVEDYYRIKNEFFVDSLFMKEGMLVASFDCAVEVNNQFGKDINKGTSVIEFYEESIVIRPKLADAFAVYLNFLKIHEFEEDEYVFTMETDNGVKIKVSKLGSHFDEAKEVMETALEKMYQRVLNNLNLALPGFSLPVLLKLAYLVRDGRCVSINALKKIDAALAPRVMDLVFEGNHDLEQKVQYLRMLDQNEQLYVGFSFPSNQNMRDFKPKAWFLCALPSLNTIAIGISNSPADRKVFFFRIVMEQGIAADKVAGKILEVNQCMVLFEYDLSPVHKDKNDLKNSKYKTALMKLAFLRLFRRSFLLFSEAPTLDLFKSDAQKAFSKAKVLHHPQLRHRQIFKSTLK